jgi:ABC-type transporter Mla subunit MlaD
MKHYSTAILVVILFLGVNTACLANPMFGILSFFQRNLRVDVVYENHRNLVQGSEVYFAGEDLTAEKILIGTVKKITLVAPQMSKVEISIDQAYKKKIFTATKFILMSNIFFNNSAAYILAVSSVAPSDKTLLKSGSTVDGITFVEYKIAAAGQELKSLMDRIKKQNDEILSQLEDYFDTVDTQDLQKKIDALIGQISQFSLEQKEAFKREVLPALRNMFDAVIKHLEQENNKKESKELEKKLQEIEKTVDV